MHFYKALLKMDLKKLGKANELQDRIKHLEKRFNCATGKTGYKLNTSCEFKSNGCAETFYLDHEDVKEVNAFLAERLLKKLQGAETEFNAL